MPSLSSFALAFLTRSDCLLAYSGLRFPSSTYFMATSTSCGSFCAKTLQLYAFWRPAPIPSCIWLRGQCLHGQVFLGKSRLDSPWLGAIYTPCCCVAFGARSNGQD